MHHRIALVILTRKAREKKRPIEVRFIHGDGGIVRGKPQRIQTIVAADVRRIRSPKRGGMRTMNLLYWRRSVGRTCSIAEKSLVLTTR
jgi:hypothetical protein